ncbi:MAG: penicillin-binding protein 2, partial [Candidatus Margulisbacteria bacterium]|nr:penicillin-binding protein 2 [Candidatus Margulisiibacteriota bacterium]
FAGALTKKEWEKLTTKSSNPFHNRALTSYPPGSIYKIITAIAALEEKLVTAAKQFFCRGYFLIGRRKALCWTTHGNISFFEAIVHSCDVVFYNLGLQLGIDKISEYAVSSGLGTPTGIDIPLEESGLIPSEEWKLERYGTSWYPGDSMNAAIGQGYVQTTPLQMATLIAACASTRNSIYRPFLCQKIVDQQGNILFQNNAYEISKLNFSLKNMDIIREALLKVVEKGTGRGAYNQYISIAGKTGTAEDPPRQKPHAWFICYAPYENPKIAIAVFIESGGHGGHIAVPIAHDLIIWWNKHRNKEIPENVIKKVH